MPSLSLLDNLSSYTESQTAVFEHGRCLRKRLNRCECTSCVEVCSNGAVSLIDRQINFKPERCTACMRCTTVCPNDAFTMSGFAPDTPIFLQKGLPSTFISCPRQEQAHPEERLMSCLGGITIEHLLALGLKLSDKNNLFGN